MAKLTVENFVRVSSTEKRSEPGNLSSALYQLDTKINIILTQKKNKKINKYTLLIVPHTKHIFLNKNEVEFPKSKFKYK